MILTIAMWRVGISFSTPDMYDSLDSSLVYKLLDVEMTYIYSSKLQLLRGIQSVMLGVNLTEQWLRLRTIKI
jgi:hypothetical protein